MARSIISAEQWEKAKEYFEHGLSLGDISDRTGISKGALSKKSKSEEWDKESPKKLLLSQAVEVSKGKETLKKHPVSIEVHEELHDEKVRREKLIYGNSELLASKIPEVLNNFIVEDTDKKTGEVKKVNLISPSDLKTLSEANDKLAITLKVAERHSPRMEVNNTTGVQVNEKRVTIARRSDRS